MTKFFTKIARKSGRYIVSVFAHEIDTSKTPTSAGYPKSGERLIETKDFANKKAALIWATEQPAAREAALS